MPTTGAAVDSTVVRQSGEKGETTHRKRVGMGRYMWQYTRQSIRSNNLDAGHGTRAFTYWVIQSLVGPVRPLCQNPADKSAVSGLSQTQAGILYSQMRLAPRLDRTRGKGRQYTNDAGWSFCHPSWWLTVSCLVSVDRRDQT